jgi:signal transduction histidine kinase
MIHPGGGSYAARYAAVYPETFETLKNYMHIKERPLAESNVLLGQLQRMSYSALASLISGAEMFIENQELWLRKGDRYYLFPFEIWRINSSDVGLTYSIASDNGYCPLRRGNVCWEVEDDSDLLVKSMIGLVILNLVLIIGWMLYRWNVKKQELRNRMLVLQILTHELRTPIASLSLTVEGFRREFEKLPESVYREFTRLCQDTRRLRQLAEASKDYLQSDSEAIGTDWIPSVLDWLTLRYEENETDVEIIVGEDAAIKASVYWLGTCLDNLVNNAAKYGVSPIKIKFNLQKNGVIFSVIDQGQLTHKDWKKLKKPFVSKAGLGLGLTIVESMVGKMGGKMTLAGPPTTFIMEIPCETDIATR